jgi:hypothetical protein
MFRILAKLSEETVFSASKSSRSAAGTSEAALAVLGRNDCLGTGGIIDAIAVAAFDAFSTFRKDFTAELSLTAVTAEDVNDDFLLPVIGALGVDRTVD